MSRFRDAYDEFRRAGFEVAAISVDSPYSHRAWAKELDIEYPLISDFSRTLATAYGVTITPDGTLPGTTRRSAFVIDAERALRYVWYESEGKGMPDVDEILAAVRGMAVRAG